MTDENNIVQYVKNLFKGVAVFAGSAALLGAAIYVGIRNSDYVDLKYENGKEIEQFVATHDAMLNSISLFKWQYTTRCIENTSFEEWGLPLRDTKKVEYTDYYCDGTIDSITATYGAVKLEITRNKGNSEQFREADRIVRELKKKYIMPIIRKAEKDTKSIINKSF